MDHIQLSTPIVARDLLWDKYNKTIDRAMGTKIGLNLRNYESHQIKFVKSHTIKLFKIGERDASLHGNVQVFFLNVVTLSHYFEIFVIKGNLNPALKTFIYEIVCILFLYSIMMNKKDFLKFSIWHSNTSGQVLLRHQCMCYYPISLDLISSNNRLCLDTRIIHSSSAI